MKNSGQKPDLSIRVRLEARSQEVKQTLERIIRSDERFRLLNGIDKGHANLLVYELGPEPEQEFKLLESSLKSGAAVDLFLTSCEADSKLLVKAMRMGAKEFFTQPINEEEVREALQRFRERAVQAGAGQPGRRGSIITVVGAKGGVGSTTIAVNLAHSLAQQGASGPVALLDTNPLFGEVPLFLNIHSPYHWGEINANISRLDETLLMNLLTKHESGIHVLSSPRRLAPNQFMPPKVMERLLTLMRTLFSYIIVDWGSQLGNSFLGILPMVDEVMVIGVLSLPSLANMDKLLKGFRQLGHPPENAVRIVINHLFKDPAIPLADVEKCIGRKIDLSIPHDPQATMAAISHGKPLAEVAPNKEITRSIQGLALSVAGGELRLGPAQERKRGGLWGLRLWGAGR